MRFTPGITAVVRGNVPGSDAPASVGTVLRTVYAASADAATTLTNTVVYNSGAAVGNMMFVVTGCDNQETNVVGSPTFSDDITSVSDDKGNVYNLVYGATNGRSQAKGGASVSIWMAKCTVALPTSSGHVTMDNATGSLNRGYIHAKCTIAAGHTLAVAGTAYGFASPGAPSAVISGLPSKQYLWIGGAADENDVIIGAAAAPFTTQEQYAGTTGGNAANNMFLGLWPLIATATGQTFTPGCVGDSVCALVAFKEVWE